MNFTAISLTWFQSALQTSKHHGHCCWQLFTSKIRYPASHCWHLCHHSICLQCCVFLQRGQHSRRFDKRFKSLCLKVVFVHLKTANQPLICSKKSRISRKFCWTSKLRCWTSSMLFFMFSVEALLHRHVGKGSSWRSCEHRTSHAIDEITKPAVARSASQVHGAEVQPRSIRQSLRKIRMPSLA